MNNKKDISYRAVCLPGRNEYFSIRNAWTLFSFVFIITSLVVSYFGLFGSWTVSVFGARHYCNWDPDGFYLGAGISFFDERYTDFVGHPGTTLMFLIHIIARGYYWFAGMFGNSLSYEIFTAKNISSIILLIKLAVTGTYLLSFSILYRISLVFVKKGVAFIAVLSFATTGIVLCYINKISPEPVMILFTLLSIFWCWKYIEQCKNYRGYIYIALSAFACTAALFSKILIVAPLFLFVLLYISFHKRLTLKKKIVGSVLFVILCGLSSLLIGWKVDWGAFFQFWSQYGPDSIVHTKDYRWFVNFVQTTNNAFIMLLKELSEAFSFASWIPGIGNKKAQFNAAELPFILIALFGLFMYWKKHHEKRRQLAWMIIFLVMIAPPVLYKGAYHYFMIHLAFLAILFSYFICTAVDKLFKSTINNQKKILIAGIAILILHSFSIAIFIESKKSDIRAYMKWGKPYYDALNKIDYHERIGLINVPYRAGIPGRLISYYTAPSSRFHKEFNKFFVFINKDITQNELKNKNISIVLDYTPNGVISKCIIKGNPAL